MSQTLAAVGGRVVPVCVEPIPDGVVIVTDGAISAVGGSETPLPEGADVVDATGSWALPGFVMGVRQVLGALGEDPEPRVVERRERFGRTSWLR